MYPFAPFDVLPPPDWLEAGFPIAAVLLNLSRVKVLGQVRGRRKTV